MNVTKLEATILQAIAQNEMNRANGGIPDSYEETETWTDCLDACNLQEGMTFPEPKQISGIVASLSKKGLVYTGDESISHSPEGFEYWKKHIAKLA